MRRCGLLLLTLLIAATAAASATARPTGINAGAFYLLTTEPARNAAYARDARILRLPGVGGAPSTVVTLTARTGSGPSNFDVGPGPRPKKMSSVYDWRLTGVSSDGARFVLSREIYGPASDTFATVLFTRSHGFVTLAKCTQTFRTNPVTHIRGIVSTTNTLGCPGDAAISPDGSHVALFLTRPGHGKWFAIVDAEGRTKVLQHAACSATDRPTWSPDATRLAYICGDPNKATSIRTIGADGAHDSVVPGSAVLHPAFNLAWSADGASLLFIGEPFHNTDRFDSEAVERGYLSEGQMLLSNGVLPMSISADGRGGDLFGPTCCMAYAPAGFGSEGLLGQDQRGAWHAFATPRDTGAGILVWTGSAVVAGRTEHTGANDTPFWAQN